MKYIIILSLAVLSASCNRKTAPATAAQPVQPTTATPAPERKALQERDIILNKTEVEVQRIEIDKSKLNQIKQALEQPQQLTPVSGNERPNEQKPMNHPPAGTKTIESDRKTP